MSLSASGRAQSDSAQAGIGGAALSWRIFFLLLAINLLTRLWAACRPLAYLDGLTIPDDAYLSLTIARNLARGLGPLYGDGPTSGFQPLYVLLMIPFYRFSADQIFLPVRGALILVSIADTVALGVLLRWAGRHVRYRMSLLILAAAWIFNGYVLGTTLNGLETMLALMLIISVLAWIDSISFRACVTGKQVWPALVLGALFGLAGLARIDSFLLGPVLAAALLWQTRRVPWRRRAMLGGMAIVGLAAIYIPWLVWLHRHTGDFYPISGRAVRELAAGNILIGPSWRKFYDHTFEEARRTLVRHDLLLIILVYVLFFLNLFLGLRLQPPAGKSRLVHAWARLFHSLAPLAWCTLFAAFLYLAYVCYMYAWWYYARYLFPLVLPMILGLVFLADYFFSFWSPLLALKLGVLLLIIVIGFGVGSASFREIYTSRETNMLGYMNIGLWARSNLPMGAVLGSTQTGALGYFAENQLTFNLDGVVNRKAYEAMRSGRILNYAREQHIEYILDWDQQIKVIKLHTADFQEGDLQFQLTIPGFLSWKQFWQLYKVRPRD